MPPRIRERLRLVDRGRDPRSAFPNEGAGLRLLNASVPAHFRLIFEESSGWKADWR